MDSGCSKHMTGDLSNFMKKMIGSLLYLIASRSNIVFCVCLCTHFQYAPKESHLTAVKRIFRYLTEAQSLGLWYPKSNVCNFTGYSDAHFGGCKIDRKIQVTLANS